MAMTRVSFRGVTVNTRTRDMILAAEKILGWQLVLTQGSYNYGVSASAGTHNGGGAIDARARDLTSAKRTAAVTALRRVGFAAWLRTPSQGNWPYHIHAIAIADPELSSGAKAQVADYKAGRNGLASNGPDDATRAYVNVTWESYKAFLARPIIHAWSMNYSTSGNGISDNTLVEARRFMAWAKALGAITPYAHDYWAAAITAKNWTLASAEFKKAIMAVQRKGNLAVDGKFGRQTGDYMDNYGYNVIY